MDHLTVLTDITTWEAICWDPSLVGQEFLYLESLLDCSTCGNDSLTLDAL